MLTKIQKDFLELCFRDGETICVSPNKYGYHSIEQKELESNFTIISPSEKVDDQVISPSDINMLCLNPVNGFRADANVTAYRNFLIEIDDGSLKEQKQYIDDIGMPYSACVFSGNKSLHFLISLEEDLLSYQMYYNAIEWVLNIVKKADQLTKNPSRSIRFPDNVRHDTGKKQTLIELKTAVKNADFYSWLTKYPDKMPREKSKR